MTAGAIDDHLGSLAELLRLQTNFPAFASYLAQAESFELNTEFDCPFVGGITFDGQTPLGDRHFNYNWRGVDIRPCIRDHECYEWALREFCGIGLDYARDPRGHRLANRAELSRLRAQIVASGVADDRAEWEDVVLWAAYDRFVDRQVKGVESEKVTLINPAMALYPYKGTPLYNKLRALGAFHD